MMDFDLIKLLLWFIVISSAGGLALMLFLTLRDRKVVKEKKKKLVPAAPQTLEWKDWHNGQHFGELFYHPQYRSHCVIVKVESRDHWYFATEKEPDIVRRSRIPINRIVGDWK